MVWERGVVIKTVAEIEIMRAAGRINALALETVRKMIKPGITTAELDAAAEDVIRSHK
jgi:methionyl aminopeptidase